MNDHSNNKYFRQYSWLQIYKCPLKDNMNNPIFHYFSQDLQGYQRTSLKCASKPERRPIKMYYEIDQGTVDTKQSKDESPVIDFDYIQYKENNTSKQIIVNQGSIVNESQWVKKYEPQKFIQLLTDQKINKDLIGWLQSWNPIVSGHIPHPKENKPKTPNIFTPTKAFQKPEQYKQKLQPRNLILLTGPPGCGKTTLVRVIAKHCKFELEEINASDDRSAKTLIEKIENISGNETIRSNKKPTLICLDEVDGAAESEANGLSKVLEYIEHGKKQPKKNIKNNKKQENQEDGKTKYEQKDKYKKKELINLNRPIIFICNDPYVRGLKQLRSKAQIIYFSTLSTQRLVKQLKYVCSQQKIYIQNNVLIKICEICKNDIRSCIGILELIVKENKLSGRNPRQIIQKLKLSFVKDNEANINQFLLALINKRKKSQISFENDKFTKIQRDVMEIGNPQLLLEYFFHNLNSLKGVFRNFGAVLKLYEDMIYSDVLARNSFRYRHQLDYYHSVPYLNFSLNFMTEEIKRIEFPLGFFERLKKKKMRQDIVETIYDNLPLEVKVYMNKRKLMGDYLCSLFWGIQSETTKDSNIAEAILRMITYGFTFKKETGKYTSGPVFHPEIDTLLTFQGKKLNYALSNASKVCMEQNFEFYRHRKDLFIGMQLKDNTEAMLNQLNLQSRKKRRNNFQAGVQYKFQQGTGTKITEKLTMKDFF